MPFENVNIDGLNIFYREAGKETAPKLVLLHGFPASSHQYRNLIPALADRFHVSAPDYPGFGNSDMPDPATFAYTFDKTSEIIEAFLRKVGEHQCLRDRLYPGMGRASQQLLENPQRGVGKGNWRVSRARDG